MAYLYIGLEKSKKDQTDFKHPMVVSEEPQLIEKIVEVPVERIVEVPVERFIDREVIIEKPIYVDRVEIQEVEKIVEIPKIMFQDREVLKYIDREHIQIKEIPYIPGYVQMLILLETLALIYLMVKGS